MGEEPAVSAIRANMMEPVWLGCAVVRTVEVTELYIVTCPEYRDGLAARHAQRLGHQALGQIAHQIALP